MNDDFTEIESDKDFLREGKLVTASVDSLRIDLVLKAGLRISRK